MNVCQRCGRISKADSIHTCTPPEPKCETQRETQRESYLRGLADGADSVSRWISVGDCLPSTKETVIAFDGQHMAPAFFHQDRNYWMAWSGWKKLDLYPFYPTHWMHLPVPPIKNGTPSSECPASHT